MRLRVEQHEDGYKAWLIEDRRDGPVAIEVGEPMESWPYPEGGPLPEQAAIELTDVKGIDCRPGVQTYILAPEVEPGSQIELLKIARCEPNPPEGEGAPGLREPEDVASFDWITRDERTGVTLRLRSEKPDVPAGLIIRTITIERVG